MNFKECSDIVETHFVLNQLLTTLRYGLSLLSEDTFIINTSTWCGRIRKNPEAETTTWRFCDNVRSVYLNQIGQLEQRIKEIEKMQFELKEVQK